MNSNMRKTNFTVGYQSSMNNFPNKLPQNNVNKLNKFKPGDDGFESDEFDRMVEDEKTNDEESINMRMSVNSNINPNMLMKTR